ncbi:MAG TPA: hypothetical protein VFG14_00545, partial [Chthoniobacteraceae bacterium]|nr:hypothetical protein [Chthoniobacteraceae bacterium]
MSDVDPSSESAETVPDTAASRDEVLATSMGNFATDTILFGRYRVLRELGRGGMGVVLLAHDSVLGIPVALKLLPDLVVKDESAIAELRAEVL